MSNFWKFLNAPLIVVLIALTTWPVLTALSGALALKIGLKQISETISEEVVDPFKKLGSEQDEKLKAELEILNSITISNVDFAHSPWPRRARVIGTITNNSQKTIKDIHISVLSHRSGKLVNVDDERLSKIKALSPQSSTYFNYETDLAEGETTQGLEVSIKVVDLSILE